MFRVRYLSPPDNRASDIGLRYYDIGEFPILGTLISGKTPISESEMARIQMRVMSTLNIMASNFQVENKIPFY